MRYFAVKERENKEVIACLQFNDLDKEQNLIVGFVADILQVNIKDVEITIYLLIMTGRMEGQRAGKKDWYLEVEDDKLYICKITRESYIEEVENL